MIPSVLAQETRDSVLHYLRTSFALSDVEEAAELFRFLEGPEGLFKGPYLDLRLPFQAAQSNDPIPLEVSPPFTPYAHQLAAFRRLSSADAHQPEHTLVTTGTGSGKTECFLYPILDHCYRNRDQQGIKAILIYPMNALAADQARRLASTLWNDPRLRNEVTAGLFVGGAGSHGIATEEHLVDKRQQLRQSPPDILLTNYRMLDFLLLRPDDRGLWTHNKPDTLRYLVLDELHTYDGAQGSDVACLIRRLRARLGTPEGGLCCVGTSATIGGESEAESVARLTQFAGDVFGEAFAPESVIREERQTIAQTLGEEEHVDVPDPTQASLEPAGFETPEAYLTEQARLWFPQAASATPDRVQLGELLKGHCFLHSILRALGGQPKRLADLDRALEEDEDYRNCPPELRECLLRSFLSLVAWARRPGGKQGQPFLTCQIQLWIRELRRLVRRVEGPEPTGEPRYRWADDHAAVRDEHWLPLARCRECGLLGLASCDPQENDTLSSNAREVGEAYLHRSRYARFLVVDGLENANFADYLYLCPGTLRIGRASECSCCQPVQTCRRVIVERTLTDPRGKGSRKFRARCPRCQGEDVLSMLGGRAASLSSVAITQVFQSPFNEDKKLLAFTDSVQDASHRASFFAARTYRFNLRTAIQSVLELQDEGNGLPLAELHRRVWDHWRQQLTDPGQRVAAFLPPDLRELPRFSKFLQAKRRREEKLLPDLLQRLAWEVAREYAYSARVGRTLERTGCSVAYPEPSRLQQALDQFHLVVSEELTGRLSRVERDQLDRFVEGVCTRLCHRGGLEHPFLRSYVEQGGGRRHLSRFRNDLVPPLSPAAMPRFFSTRATAGEFDLFPGPKESWFNDWASRTLGVEPQEQQLVDVYRALARALVAAEVWTEIPLVKGNGRAYALPPQALRVTRNATRIRCQTCRGELTLPEARAPAWLGQACMRYRCPGSYAELPRDREQDYYARLYRGGSLERIFAAEHSALLDRQVREALERDFKAKGTGSDVAPDAPNLLVCTPTLEMGVDVGDLSATLLCSIPRTTASYLQRIGRAGRKTGNALCLALANARPHDLFFYADPDEMIQGEVSPPGCFLDAPEMLRRQLAAHAFDCWAQTSDLEQIPRRTGTLLRNPQALFPRQFVEWHGANEPATTAAFLELFGDTVSPATRAALEEFAGTELTQAVEGAFDEVRGELARLDRRYRRLSERARKLEEDPALKVDEELQRERDELRSSVRVLARLRKELRHKYPLNVLTDAGILPNYAFPEPGVRLRAGVRMPVADKPGGAQKKASDKKTRRARYRWREYMRPASQAIRELAPFNTFYAEGYKARVTTVDVGNPPNDSRIESWRLCPECSHAARVFDDSTKEDACPVCGNDQWPGEAQRRDLVRFHQATSLDDLLKGVNVDEKEDREQQSYFLESLIEPPKDPGRHGARLIESLPFGFELLDDMTLRELNCGLRPTSGSLIDVAGSKVPELGFRVCQDCGRVAERDYKEQRLKVHHAPYCRYWKAKRSKTSGESDRLPQQGESQVYLYRELNSEALRLLLPVGAQDVETSTATWRAILSLGLRRKFGGQVAHLGIANASEPVLGGHSEGSRPKRNYLVLYDRVPGGTGYLANLWKDDGLFEVLELAQRALASCACRTKGLDGCYRCLFAFQPERDLQHLSRTRASQAVTAVLERKDKAQNVKTLSEASLAECFESELERRFFAALREHATQSPNWTWEDVTLHGETCARIQVGGRTWLLEPQIPLGPPAVPLETRPDFLARPQAPHDDCPTVAVYCDGFEYHACPTKPRARIEDDLWKRQELRRAGYVVWSVAYNDVEEFRGYQQPGHPLLLRDPHPETLHALGEALEVKLPANLCHRGSMSLLCRFLENPDRAQWARATSVLCGALALQGAHDQTLIDPPAFAGLEESLRTSLDPPTTASPSFAGDSPAGFCCSGRTETGYARVAFQFPAETFDQGPQVTGVLRLYDRHSLRQSSEFEPDWRAALQAWNLLQFQDGVVWLSSEYLEERGLDQAPAPAAPAAEVEQPDPAAEEVDEELEAFVEDMDVDQSCVAVLRQLRAGGAVLPEIGYFVVDQTPTELAWVECKVAVLSRHCEQKYPEHKDRFTRAGWTVFGPDAEPEAVLQAIGVDA